ncbi:hypothetical protein HZU77_003540 [Neisseriaceae bacterium TC5R-5]|nr:hypothetical protein [Neisseriaceae bacterium TC5R-5]
MNSYSAVIQQLTVLKAANTPLIQHCASLPYYCYCLRQRALAPRLLEVLLTAFIIAL